MIFENVQYDYCVYIRENVYDNPDNALEYIVDGSKSITEGISSVRSLIMDSVID